MPAIRDLTGKIPHSMERVATGAMSSVGLKPVLTPQQISEAKRQHIMDHWIRSGGASSAMGLPFNGDFQIRAEGGDSVVDFRGGLLRLKSDSGNQVFEEVARRVRVTFEGYGLDTKQEHGGDELYGNIGAHLGSTGFTNQWNLAEVTLGASSHKGDRVYQNPITIHDGQPMDLNLIVTMIEHDSGDKNKIRGVIQAHVKQLFDGATALLSGGVGGALGAASSAFAAEGQSANSLTSAITSGIGSFLTDLLGIGDDPYNPGGINIFANDMIQIPPEKQYRCGQDSRVLTYTHRVIVSGRDGGGSVGQISALFLVRHI